MSVEFEFIRTTDDLNKKFQDLDISLTDEDNEDVKMICAAKYAPSKIYLNLN